MPLMPDCDRLTPLLAAMGGELPELFISDGVDDLDHQGTHLPVEVRMCCQ